jgi:hypothetical protein
MFKTSIVVLTAAGALFLAAPPAAQAAPRAEAKAAMTQDFSAVVVRKRVVVRSNGVRSRTVVRRYPAPSYYGYYGPTYYERPYARPAPVVFRVGGWW